MNARLTTTLASPGSAGDAVVRDMTPDGRYVLYNQDDRIFLRDMIAGTVQTVAVDPVDETENDAIDRGSVNGHAVSPDGRLVLFTEVGLFTSRINPATGERELWPPSIFGPPVEGHYYHELFVWDRSTGTVREVAPSESLVDRRHYDPVFSPDGRFVTFASDADDLVPGDEGSRDLFRIDLQTGSIQRLFEKIVGSVSVSADGRYVAVGTSQKVARLDTTAGETRDIDGVTNAPPTMSADGRYIAFITSEALSAADTNGVADVYVQDMETGTVQLVSSTASGEVGNGASTNAVISGDGSRVAFVTAATNLTSGSSSGGVVVKSLAFGEVAYVAPGGLKVPPSISHDGLTLAFSTTLGLVSGDGDLDSDVYVVRFARPELTIDVVAGDDYLNAAELQGPVIVRGTSDAFSRPHAVTTTGGLAEFDVATDGGDWAVQFPDLSGLSDGAHRFTVRTSDEAGVEGEASRVIVVDRVAPTLPGFVVAGDNVINAAELGGFAVAGASDAIDRTVLLSVGGVVLGGAQVNLAGQWATGLDLTGRADGVYAMSAEVSDVAGNRTTLAIGFEIDTKPPKIDILSVADDNVVSMTEAGKPVAVRGTSDAIGRTVTLFDGGGSELGTALVLRDGTWRADVDLGAVSGRIDVQASVRDAAGNLGLTSQSVHVDSPYVRVSTKSDGSQGDETRDTSDGYNNPAISPDGRFVVFEAFGQGLVSPLPEFPNFSLLVKDMATGTVRALLPPDESGAPAVARDPDFSADGRYLTFSSSTPLMAEGEETALGGIFRMEMATGEIRRVNANAAGEPANGGWGDNNTYISADGRFVVFQSSGTNLVPGTQERDDFLPDVYVKDMDTGEVRLVSLNQSESMIPGAGFGFMNNSNIGGERYVAFSTAVAVDPRDTNGLRDIYVRDLVTGDVTLASATPGGAAGNGETLYDMGFSPDGRYLAFSSRAQDLVPGEDAFFGLYLRDMTTGVTRLLSSDAHDPARGSLFSFSADGRFLAFSTREDIDPGDVDRGSKGGYGMADIYVLDIQTGSLRLATSGNLLGGLHQNYAPANYHAALTPDASYLAFTSAATTLVPGDTNGLTDIYLRALAPDSITIDPVTGDDRIDASELAARVPIGGRSTAIGGEVTVRIGTRTVATAVVEADGTWSTSFDASPFAGRRTLIASVESKFGFTASDGAIVTIDPAAEGLDLSANPNAVDVDLGAGTVRQRGSTAAAFDAAAPILSTGSAAGATRAVGSAFGDRITGSGGNDTIEGGPGADRLSGRAGDDLFILRAGDAAPGERIDGGADRDRISILGGGTVDLSGATIAGVEEIVSDAEDTVLIVADVARARRIVDMAGDDDTVHVANWTGNRARGAIDLLTGRGIERVTWADGGDSYVAEVDGGLIDVTLTDVSTDGTGRPYQTAVRSYEADGSLRQQVRTYDNGVLWTANYDADGVITDLTIDASAVVPARSHPSIVNTYEGGRLDQSVLIAATGVRTVKDFDVSDDTGRLLSRFREDLEDAFDWSTFTESYDAAGAPSHRVTVYDDGSTVELDFVNGLPAERLVTHADGRTSLTTYLDGEILLIRDVAVNGDQKIRGGSRDDVLAGGAGNDQLAGGPGDDVFVFSGSFGRDRIRDFTPGDRLDLRAHGIDEISDVSAGGFGLRQSGANAVIDLGAHGTITLLGIASTSLTDGSFVV